MLLDPDTNLPIGVEVNSTICNHYEPEEVEQIPHISDNVKAALDFLGKDDDGFFLMYEQGDIGTYRDACSRVTLMSCTHLDGS